MKTKKPAAAKKPSPTAKRFLKIPQLSLAEVAARDKAQNAPLSRFHVGEAQSHLFHAADILGSIERLSILVVDSDAGEEDYAALALANHHLAHVALEKIAAARAELDTKRDGEGKAA